MPWNKLPLAFAFTVSLGLGAVALAQDVPALVPDPAIATMTPAELVAARQAAMKQNGQTLRGAGGLTGDAAVAAATSVLQNFTNLPEMFPEGSMVGDTKALPIIWQQKDAFLEIFAEGRTVAGYMLTAAQTGNAQMYGDALQSLNNACRECHSVYQAD